MVKLDSISKSFGGKPVVENISLEIEAGERFTLLGRSGCGKTTLLRLIAGFETPDSGTIAIEGQDVGSLPIEQRPVGLIFQNYALFPHMTVYDNIAVGPRIRGHAEIDIAKNIDELLEITHLQALRDAHPGQISGGEAQRVALARAVINRPKILLLDEPLSALGEHWASHSCLSPTIRKKPWAWPLAWESWTMVACNRWVRPLNCMKNRRLLSSPNFLVR